MRHVWVSGDPEPTDVTEVTVGADQYSPEARWRRTPDGWQPMNWRGQPRAAWSWENLLRDTYATAEGPACKAPCVCRCHRELSQEER